MEYESVIESLGLRIIVREDIGDWQGDLLMVVRDGYYGKFGFVVVGYGSCSGCDAWQACDTWRQRLDLMSDILNNSKWFDDLDDLKTWMENEFKGNSWYSHEPQFAGFLERVAEI